MTKTLSLVVSILSLLISGAAFWVSYRAYDLSQVEMVTIDMDPDGGDDATIVDPGKAKVQIYLVEVPWDIRVSNVGNRKVSIVKHSVGHISDEVARRLGYSESYDGLDGGLWRNGKPIHLPIVLDAGESVILKQRIGLVAARVAEARLRAIYPNGGKISRRDMYSSLAESRIDLFGNRVDVLAEKPLPGGSKFLYMIRLGFSERICIDLRTAKGDLSECMRQR